MWQVHLREYEIIIYQQKMEYKSQSKCSPFRPLSTALSMLGYVYMRELGVIQIAYTFNNRMK